MAGFFSASGERARPGGCTVELHTRNCEHAVDTPHSRYTASGGAQCRVVLTECAYRVSDLIRYVDEYEKADARGV